MHPTLYGDGRHDDSDAIEALFQNRSVTFPADAGYDVAPDINGRLGIIGGEFLLLRGDIDLSGGNNLHFENVYFKGPGATTLLNAIRARDPIEVPLSGKAS